MQSGRLGVKSQQWQEFFCLNPSPRTDILVYRPMYIYLYVCVCVCSSI
jgi:hypothetical protein